MTNTPQDARVNMLADWQRWIDDQPALLSNPDAYTQWLTEQANAAQRKGLIDDDDLREMLELVDAACEWAKEERLIR